MWNKPSETKPSSQGSAAPVASKSDVQTAIKPEPKSEVSVQPAVAPATAVATPHPASAVGNAAPVTAPIRNSAPAPSAPTTIGTGLNIKGEVTGSSDLFIDGEAQGRIVLSDSKGHNWSERARDCGYRCAGNYRGRNGAGKSEGERWSASERIEYRQGDHPHAAYHDQRRRAPERKGGNGSCE